MKTLMALVIVAASAACTDSSAPTDGPALVEVDLSTFPETAEPVPNGTILDDQWHAIGLDIAAEPEGVDPIKHDFGTDTPHLFFDPDQAGVTAVFTFVDPATGSPTEATSFSLAGYFNPGESAQLIGFDDSGAETTRVEVTPDDIGSTDRTIRMRITGRLMTVRWVTQGDPGIAAKDLTFTL